MFGDMMKKTKIWWSHKEREIVARKAKEILVNFPAQSEIEAIRTAQKELPEERWRTFPSAQSADPVIRLMEEVVVGPVPIPEDVRERVLSELSEDEILRRFKEVIFDNVDDEEAFRRFKHPVLKRVSLKGVVQHYSTWDLLDAIPFREVAGYVANRQADMLDQIRQKLSDQPDVQVAPRAVRQVVQSPSVQSDTRPKVLVVGTIPRQQVVLEDALGDVVRLSFIDKDKQTGMKKLPSADLYVIWTDFVRHVTTALAPNGKSIFHSGGVQVMVDRIRERLGL